jgi:hypothetical protein
MPRRLAGPFAGGLDLRRRTSATASVAGSSVAGTSGASPTVSGASDRSEDHTLGWLLLHLVDERGLAVARTHHEGRPRRPQPRP